MKRLWLAGLFGWLGFMSLGDAPVAKIQAILAKPKILCGRFEQSKQLVGLKRPVLSNGRFCVLA